MAQQQRTDPREPQGALDSSGGGPSGQPDDIGDSRGSGGEHAPQSQSTRGTPREEGSEARTGDAEGGEQRRDAERGLTQHPDRNDPASGGTPQRGGS